MAGAAITITVSDVGGSPAVKARPVDLPLRVAAERGGLAVCLRRLRRGKAVHCC